MARQAARAARVAAEARAGALVTISGANHAAARDSSARQKRRQNITRVTQVTSDFTAQTCDSWCKRSASKPVDIWDECVPA